MQRTIAFRLPLPGYPRAEVVTDFGLTTGRVLLDGRTVLESTSGAELARGVSGRVDGAGTLLLAANDGEVDLLLDGRPAVREDRLCAPPSRSAWIHAGIALAGSAAGFAASWLYLVRAGSSGDPWAMKMGLHMAAWHFLLTVTLFPASVWGQRPGIRAVQAASAVFFLIHLGIALANLAPDPAQTEGPGIALLNATSGLAFLAATLYGNRAHRDMDPLRALDLPVAADLRPQTMTQRVTRSEETPC